MQAGGRRFESDHLHHFGGVELIGWYRGEAKAIGVDGSKKNCDAGGVSEGRCRPSGDHRIKSGDDGLRAGLCQGESGSGASLGAATAKSDRTLRRPCGGYGVQRRLLCAEQE